MFPQRFLVVIGVLAALPWNASFAWGMPQDEDFFKRGNKPPFIKKPAKAEDLITFKIAVEPTQVRRGEIAKVTVTGIPAPGAYTYPLTKRAAGQKESGLVQDLVFETPPGLKALWPVSESEPELEFVPVEKTNYLKHKKPFTWTRDVLVLPDAEPGRKTLVVKTKGLQVCNDRTCIPADQELRTEIDVTDAPAVELSAETAKRLEEERPAVGVVGKLDNGDTPQPRAPVTPPLAAAFPIDQSTAEYQTALSAIQQQIQAAKKDAPPVGLLVFVLQGFFWGAVSLITPCVFPMIPITVSFFLKQSEKQHYRPVTLAIVYCLTIVIVLTISAVTLLAVFQELSIHPATNFLIGGLFVFFALSLFGMYDIELPSALTRFTSAREGKGGLLGVMFMALTFTIVSFACVAPFLGGFGGTAGGSAITWTHRILGGLAFSVTFAAPFFILALFPTLLQRLPKSGSWLNSVKVVMGFLELAAALKFFRQAELNFRPTPELFTYDLVLGMWIAIAILCGLYLLNVYRLPHDSPAESIGVPRLMFGFLFLSLAFYLVPAMFKFTADGQKQRPRGTIYAWIDSFLLPDPTKGGEELAWSANLPKVIQEARATARRTGQPQYVFVDFTGETCSNCKLNENNVFTKDEIKRLFEKYNLVQLYTDKVPEKFYSSGLQSTFGNSVGRQQADAHLNRQFQSTTFGTVQLPLYVILKPLPDEDRIEEVARYDEGKINDESEFAEFLRQPFDRGDVQARANGN
jgi:thiol:disulfide interchange protein DsbD